MKPAQVSSSPIDLARAIAREVDWGTGSPVDELIAERRRGAEGRTAQPAGRPEESGSGR